MLTAGKPKAYRSAGKIPPYLIYEVLDGRPLYYKNYKEVASGKKTFEEIMGASGLQAILVSYLMKVLIRQLDEEKYRFVTGEVGLHLDYGNNLANDVAVYEKSILTPDKINIQYIDVPAVIAIEIDVKADLSDPLDFNYVQQKTQKLLDFGTGKVVWIFTATQKVLTAQSGQDWLLIDWQKDIELLDKHFFNIGKYLEKEGIEIKKQ